MICVSCKKKLELLFDHGDPDDKQFENALEIEFSGGYGMFIDPFLDSFKAVLCHECAHELCAKVQWIYDYLNPAKSHSHKDAYREENPDHFGWDYDYVKEMGNE